MMTKYGITTLVSALALTTSSSVWAQELLPGNERGPRDQASPAAVRAPRKAFEIGVVGAYTQPFGKIANNRVIDAQVDAGGAIGLDLGYRFNPYWSIGSTHQYHDSGAVGALEGNTSFRGIATGVQGTFHMAPYSRVDPYLTLGTGYRLLWRSSDVAGTPSLLTHGLQLGKALFGIDFRLSESLALGPVVGADVNVFLWDNPEGAVGNQAIASGDRRPSTFIFAGLAARFDLGGTRKDRGPVMARTVTPIDATAMEQPTPAAGPPTPRTAPTARPPTSMVNVVP